MPPIAEWQMVCPAKCLSAFTIQTPATGMALTSISESGAAMAEETQSTDIRIDDIETMERLWNDAILRRDVDSAASFQAPEYRLVIGVEGQPLQVVRRELWLSVLPRYVIREHKITDMHVSIWNGVAVATLAITQDAEPLNGRDISGKFLITDIWVLRDGKWQIAERHSSRQEKASVAVRGAFEASEKGS